MKEAFLTGNRASRRMNFGIGIYAGTISSMFVSSALGASEPVTTAVLVPGMIMSFYGGTAGMLWGIMDAAYYGQSIGINLKKFGQGAGLAFAIASGSGLIASMTHDDPVSNADRSANPAKTLAVQRAAENVPLPLSVR
ncbi:MAG TPA: hypothetical protein PKX87_05380 [Alphaproteobacteria bacterium]|nr:hypothetical protein [Alphaproteobacteria bacterium]